MGSDLDAGIKNNHSEPEPDSLKAETPAAQHPEYYVDNPGLLLYAEVRRFQGRRGQPGLGRRAVAG